MPSIQRRSSPSQLIGVPPAASRHASPGAPVELSQASRADQAQVDDAADRARLRRMVKRPDDERIPDEVIVQLLAGASSEEEIAGPGARCWRS
jgi:hypothetical protein